MLPENHACITQLSRHAPAWKVCQQRVHLPLHIKEQLQYQSEMCRMLRNSRALCEVHVVDSPFSTACTWIWKLVNAAVHTIQRLVCCRRMALHAVYTLAYHQKHF